MILASELKNIDNLESEDDQFHRRNSETRTQDGFRYVRHGCGVQTWPNGGEYDGFWYNDKIYGQGKFAYPNGDTYDGNFVDGKAQGYGVYV